MTLTESRPPDLIRIKLDFVRPFSGTNNVEFTFRPEGNQTIAERAASRPGGVRS